LKARQLLFILCFFSITLCSLYGQQTISGTVINAEGVSVRGANVVLQVAPERQISSFAITTSDGTFKLTTLVFTDSLWLKVSHLNHDDQSRWITPTDSVLNFVLQDRVYDLPTMTVKQEAVIRKGDTLVFDVNQLREVGDESIEQLLRNIPGIEIAANGTISYQDLEISKFYIEGLDMLEGRYAIATRNLNLDAIRDIEILEHHQPIRALDSLVRPPNAAINLRLKSGITLTGTVRGGLGATPLLHQAEATLFGFAKKQQFSLLGSANNVGNATGDNFRDLYQSETFILPLVQATMASPPLEANPTHYLDNNERSGGFNFLRKTGPNTQLKWNGYLTHDRLRSSGRNELTYRDTEEEITIKEQLQSSTRPRVYNNRLLYEINNKRFYLKSSIEGQYGIERTEASNLFNESTSQERFERGDLSINGKLSSIIRRGQKAYRIKGKFSYRDERNDLQLKPLFLLLPGLPATRLDSARQAARRRYFTANVHTNLFFRRNQIRGETRFGLRTQQSRLSSDLVGEDENPLGNTFSNDNQQLLLAPYLLQRFTHERPRRTWTLSLPLATHFFSFRGRPGEELTSRKLLVAKPELSYVRRLKHQRIFFASYAYELDYNQDELIFTGYILRRNRNFSQSLPNLNRTRQHTFASRLQGQNRKGSLSFNTHLTAEHTVSEFLAATSFEETGETSSQVATRNIRQRIGLNNRFNFSLFSGLMTKIETNYSVLFLPLLLNGNRAKTTIHQFTLAPEFTYVFTNSALSLKPEAKYFTNTLAASPVLRLNLRWGYFHQFPDNWGSLKVSLDQYQTRIVERSVRNSLLNIRYKRPVLSGKFELSILLNNLTNAEDFVSFTQGAYSEELSFFNLRGRQLLLVFGKKI
jgi:hypothetical protein